MPKTLQKAFKKLNKHNKNTKIGFEVEMPHYDESDVENEEEGSK